MTNAIPFSTVLMQIPERASRTAVAPQDLHDMVSKAFLTALLLTGSAERAEAAILEGNAARDLDSTPNEGLFRGAVNAAIELYSETSEQPPEDLEHASCMLPFELRRVLHLPPALRHCFVLRFLVGLPREVCAQLLHLEIHQVDERARTAVLELPAIQRNGKVFRTN
jgi:DNA-directed RNA polymerase specialized sigma24 family protein